MVLKQNKQKGFTLIELVVYVGIMSMLVAVMGAMFGQIVEVQLESEATSSVDQDGRYILGKMIYDMKSLNVSDNLVAPANPGNQGNTLQLRINSILYTYSVNGSGNLIVTDASTGQSNQLNGSNTSVSGLNFQRIGSGGVNDTIRMTFVLSTRVSQHSGTESRTFTTTLSRQ